MYSNCTNITKTLWSLKSEFEKLWPIYIYFKKNDATGCSKNVKDKKNTYHTFWNVCFPSGFGHLLPLSYRLKEVELWGPVPCFLLIVVVVFLPRILSASVLGTCTVMPHLYRRLPFSIVFQNNCVGPVDHYAKRGAAVTEEIIYPF
jgi:hypothetical protein